MEEFAGGLGSEVAIGAEQVGEVSADLGRWQACRWVKGVVLGQKGYGPQLFRFVSRCY